MLEINLNKDLTILNLLLGWEIIHLSKKGKKVTMRLREFLGKGSRFIRVIFSKCDLAVFLELNNGQIENFTKFNFQKTIFCNINEENDGIIGIYLLKETDLIGILKIISTEITFEFTKR